MNLQEDHIHFPTIIKLRVKEKEIKSNLKLYRQTHNEYVNILSTGSDNGDEATGLLNKLSGLNDKIKKLLGEARSLMKSAYPKGIHNQDLIAKNNKGLLELVHKLNDEDREVQKLLQESEALDAEKVDTRFNITRTKSHYLLWIILMCAMVSVTITALVSPGESRAENLIFILVCFVLLYYLIQYLYNKFS